MFNLHKRLQPNSEPTAPVNSPTVLAHLLNS